MQKDIEITLAPEELGQDAAIRKALSIALKTDQSAINGYQVLKRSIDVMLKSVEFNLTFWQYERCQRSEYRIDITL